MSEFCFNDACVFSLMFLVIVFQKLLLPLLRFLFKLLLGLKNEVVSKLH